MRGMAAALLATALSCIMQTTSAQEACCADVCIGGAGEVCSRSQCVDGFETCVCAGACDSRAVGCVSDACYARKDKGKRDAIIAGAVLGPLALIAASIVGCAYCCKCCCFAPKEGQHVNIGHVGGTQHQLYAAGAPHATVNPTIGAGIAMGSVAQQQGPLHSSPQTGYQALASPPPPPGPSLPQGWSAITDPSTQRTYYAHTSGKTQWERPEASK